MNNVLDQVYRKNWIKRCIEFIVGLFIISIAYNLFTRKCNLVYGVAGIGLMVNSKTGMDNSFVILACNVLLLLISFFTLGGKSTSKTIAGSLLFPVFVKLTEDFSLVDIGNLEPLLVVLCSSLLTGLGLGLVFRAGYTTGGTDILNAICSKYGKMSMGKAMYFTDLFIILFAIVVFDFPTFVYSVLNMYIVSLITDRVVLGISGSKAFYIVTEHETDVKRFITKNLHHGVTVLEARGGYTGDMKKVIMCIVPTREYYSLKEGVRQIDNNAFFIVTDAYEVSGGK